MTFNFQLSTWLPRQALDFLRRHWLTLVVILAVLGGAWWGFSAWNRAREIRLATETGALQSEISNLKSQAAEAEKSAGAAKVREQEVQRELEKSEVRSQKLAANLERAQAEATAEKARIAALTAEKLGPELQKTVPTAGILRFAHDDKEGARRVLEIITDRDACVQLSTLNSQLLANCRESLVDYAAIGEQQAKQIQDLKQALDLGKRAFDKRDDLAKVQAKTAQGTWIHRAWNKVKFPVGIALGGVAGYAVGRAMR